MTRSKRRAGPAPQSGRSARAQERNEERGLQRTAGNQAAARVLAPPAVVAPPVAAPPVVEAPPDVNATLGSGDIPRWALEDYLAEAGVDDVRRLRGNQALLRNLLRHPLGESWTEAKHLLAYSASEVDRALMAELVQFRELHWKTIIEKTQTAVNAKHGPKGLTRWPAAGSTTLTSDIDVNLKGDFTEEAVAVFNDLFKQDGWEFEPGVVYDVNVYAMDFMHAFGGVDVGGVKMSGKEGKRGALATGGFQTAGPRDRDAADQDVWALVKARIHMGKEQWDAYVEAIGVDKHSKGMAGRRYREYLGEMEDEMSEISGSTAEAIDRASAESGSALIAEKAEELSAGTTDEEHSAGAAENLKMAASNRVYEAKLLGIAGQRAAIGKLIADFNAASAAGTGTPEHLASLNQQIESKLFRLRQEVSEAALWSNEAYVTDASVNHAVVGLQSANPIHLSAAEMLTAVTENMADAVKEITRHSESLHEAGMKASKYLLRMTDAAKNAGLGEVLAAARPGVKVRLSVERLYKAAYEIAVNIKGAEPLPPGITPNTIPRLTPLAGTDAQKVDQLMHEIGVTTPAELIAATIAVATAVQVDAKARYTDAERHYLAAPASATKNALSRL